MKQILALTAIVMASFTFAQTGAKVNSQEVLILMPEYKDAELAVQKKQEELQNQLLMMQQKLQFIQAELDSLMSNNAPEYVLEGKQIDLQGEYTKFQSLQQRAPQIIQDFSAARMEPIQEKFQAAVKVICEAKGIDFVMEVTTLIYSSNNLLDITADVIKELGLNAGVPNSGGTTPPAGGQ